MEPRNTPVQQQRILPSKGPGPGNSFRSLKAPAILVSLYIIYLVVFVVIPALVSDVGQWMGDPLPPIYRMIGAVVLFVVFSILILFLTFYRQGDAASSKRTGPPAVTVAETGPRQVPQTASIGDMRFKPVMDISKEVRRPEPSSEARMQGTVIAARPQVIVYPSDVGGGIYGDTFIRLSQNKVLRMRSMIVDESYL